MSEIKPIQTVAAVVGVRKRTDDANLLAAEIAAVAEMTYSDLRLAWRRHYRSHPPKKLSRDIMELGVAMFHFTDPDPRGMLNERADSSLRPVHSDLAPGGTLGGHH